MSEDSRDLADVEARNWTIKWDEHVPLLIGGVSTLFISIRILSMANFNPQTAYGILQAGGTAAVIIGAILSIIGTIALLAAVFACLQLIIPAEKKNSTSSSDPSVRRLIVRNDKPLCRTHCTRGRRCNYRNPDDNGIPEKRG